MEIWKDVKGYEGIYKISDYGSLKSNKNYKKASVNKYGYYQTTLYKNGKKRNALVHRLVAEAFLPNPNNKPTINHKDGNKLNNRVDNLEWATNKEQTNHSINVLGNKSVISDKCRKRQIELHQRKVKRSDGMVFESIKIASDGNESLRKHINACCRGQRKTAGGYSWEYV